jgi:hypothetical protein
MSRQVNRDDCFEDDDNQPLITGCSEFDQKDGKFPKKRQVLGFLGFSGFAVIYAMRVNLSISIVSMVNQTAINSNTNQSFTDVCPFPTPTNSSVPAVRRDSFFPIFVQDDLSFRTLVNSCGTSMLRELFSAHFFTGTY